MAALSASVAAGVALTPDPVDPTTELPMLVRFVHGQGGEDLLSVGSDGVVVGWLGGQDGNRPVGCLANASFIRDLAAAAADDLEQGATEPDRDGNDYERMEVTGRGGTAWMGDGGIDAVVASALRLVGEVHHRDAERTFCRETPETTPGDLTGGVGLFRDDPRAGYLDRVFVTTAGDVTGRTEHGLLSCRVPAATAMTLTTAELPEDRPQEKSSDVRIGFERGTTTGLADPAGDDPFTTTARALLTEVPMSPQERSLCTPVR